MEVKCSNTYYLKLIPFMMSFHDLGRGLRMLNYQDYMKFYREKPLMSSLVAEYTVYTEYKEPAPRWQNTTAHLWPGSFRNLAFTCLCVFNRITKQKIPNNIKVLLLTQISKDWWELAQQSANIAYSA
jgi:hypothetical protein